MSRQIYLRPRAEADLDGHFLYIADDNPEAAARFLEALESAFRLLAENNEIGSLRDFNNPRLEGIRMWPVHGFEHYLVFYVPTTTGIDVVRVLHSSRDIAAHIGDE